MDQIQIQNTIMAITLIAFVYLTDSKVGIAFLWFYLETLFVDIALNQYSYSDDVTLFILFCYVFEAFTVLFLLSIAHINDELSSFAFYFPATYVLLMYIINNCAFALVISTNLETCYSQLYELTMSLAIPIDIIVIIISWLWGNDGKRIKFHI